VDPPWFPLVEHEDVDGENPWGKTWEKPWENHGENHGKTMGKPRFITKDLSMWIVMYADDCDDMATMSRNLSHGKTA
jgi:hypothetical protein